jgi:vancomycin resistance protein YoaR
VDESEGPAVEGTPVRRIASRRTLLLGAVFALAALAGTAGNVALVRASAGGRVLPGVSVSGAGLAGLDGPATADRIASVAPRALTRAGKLQIRDRVFEIRASDLGLTVDVAATSARALTAGREGSWLRQFGWLLARAFSGAPLPVSLHVDAQALEARLEFMERAALGDPAVEGAVSYAGGIVLTTPRAGLGVDRDGVKQLLERAFVHEPGSVIALPVRAITPKLSQRAVDLAAQQAAALIAPITLSAPSGEARLVFSAEHLGRALRARVADGAPPRLDVDLDGEALKQALAELRGPLETPARDATFSVNARREVSIVPSELGTRLDDEVILSSIIELARGTARAGVLAFKTDVTPALTTEQAEGLHVRALVAHYTTPFPCCEARVKNIERIAALVNGSIVRPGESYSLNARSGPRTAANGFVAGPTIVEGEMDMTVGGGVSQFATTLFNAAFDGGYEIIQRQAHTYWFPRYPEGYDATLGFPLPDLVFRNDTESAIFIKTEVGKNYVRVELYGDNGRRRVERHVTPRFEIVKPETVLEPNPELRPDEEKVKFGGWTGWSLHVSRVITFGDGQKKEERRKVIYSPRARRVEVHPCKIPEGQPGHTGERCPKLEAPDGGAVPMPVPDKP